MDPVLLFWLAVLVMIVGLIGVVVPGIPGVPLVWLAAAGYGVLDGFQHLSLLRFLVLTVLALFGAGAGLLGTQLMARAGGASGWSALAGSCLAVLGLIFFTLPAALLIAVAGVFGLEWRRGKTPARAAVSSAGWLVGWGLATAIEFLIAVAVILLFVQNVASR